MSLTCDTGCEFELNPGDVVYDDYPKNITSLEEPSSIFKVRKRKSSRKRCMSCHEMINFGDDVAKFDRYKVPETEMEKRIYGDAGDDSRIPLASRYLCFVCASKWMNLESIGYAVYPENARGDFEEYLDQRTDRRKIEDDDFRAYPG